MDYESLVSCSIDLLSVYCSNQNDPPFTLWLQSNLPFSIDTRYYDEEQRTKKLLVL